MSVSCAMWATSLNQWARRYIRLTQPARCGPEKRARLRAFYANGVDKMHTPWAVEGLPMLLHLSLFLFFGGLAIYLFNVDQEVFTCVVSWVGLFLIVYGLISLLPVIWPDSPYNTPLSTPLWYLFSYISLAAFIVVYFTFLLFCLAFFGCIFGLFACCSNGASEFLGKILRTVKGLHRWRLGDVKVSWWDGRKSGGVKRIRNEATEKQSPVIDGRILSWTIGTLGDDDSLQKFFEAMPGFFDSEKVKGIREHLPYDLLRDALAGFLGRTLSSKSVIHSVKLHRLDIFMDTIKLIGEDSIRVASILETFLLKRWDLAPQTIEAAHALARWTTSDDQRTALYARCTVARVLATVQEHDDRWFELAAHISGLPERDLRSVARTVDNLLFANLIDLCRQADTQEWKIVDTFPRFDMPDTLPRLQHDFCALWNETVDKARIHGDPESASVRILCSVRHHYVTLHPGTGLPEMSHPYHLGFILLDPSLYPQCNIAGHRCCQESIGNARVTNSFPNQPDESPHSLVRRSTYDGITVSQQVKQDSITTRPRSLSEPTTKVIPESSQKAPTTTSSPLPAHTNPYPTPASLPLPEIPPVTTMPYPQEGATRKDIAPCAEPDCDEKLTTVSTTAPTRTLAPVPASTRPVLDHSLASCDAGAASAPNPLPSASSVVGFSIPAVPPPSHIPPSTVIPSPNSESLGLLSSTIPSHLTGSPTFPRLRTRGLMNTKNASFVNAVLQILVHSPLFWNLFRELGVLRRRRAGGPETGSGTTPLVDATVRLFEEFMLKEKEPPQEPEAAREKPREVEEAKKMHDVFGSFEPMYMYEAMKEKRQLKDLLVRHNDRDASFCY